MEAFIIIPLILVLSVVFIRFGLMLHDGLTESHESIVVRDANQGPKGIVEKLKGDSPANRIRNADLLIDFGYNVKELLPSWLSEK